MKPPAPVTTTRSFPTIRTPVPFWAYKIEGMLRCQRGLLAAKGSRDHSHDKCIDETHDATLWSRTEKAPPKTRTVRLCEVHFT
jgi:hypothetical protein